MQDVVAHWNPKDLKILTFLHLKDVLLVSSRAHFHYATFDHRADNSANPFSRPVAGRIAAFCHRTLRESDTRAFFTVVLDDAHP